MQTNYAVVRQHLLAAQVMLECEDDISEKMSDVIELLIDASIKAEKAQKENRSNVLHLVSFWRRKNCNRTKPKD